MQPAAITYLTELCHGRWTGKASFHAANNEPRLADKALDVLHHLACRGSVWPEASATAVRELRDRITRRPTRHSGPNDASKEMERRTGRAPDGSTVSRHYTSSSGLTPQPTDPIADQGRTTSSIGLSHEVTNPYGSHSAAGGSNGHDDEFRQDVSAIQVSENAQSFNMASAVPQQNISTPVFDFGNSEWTDFMQASDTFDSSIPLPQADSMDPYIGFDIPFWLGQDQYQDMLQDRG